MIKKSKGKKAAKEKQKPKNISEYEYLEMLLDFSLKAANGLSDEIDSLFINQANRIKIKMDKIKGKQ